MGFKVQGFGTSPRELTNALDGIERELRLLVDLPLQPGTIPEGKAALRARAEKLDQQIELLEKHQASPDPKLQGHATELLEVAKRERLRLEDGLLAWAMDDIARRIPASTTGPAPIATELAAVSALLDGLLSPAEIKHVVNVIGPLAGKNVALEALGPTIDASNADHARRSKKTSKEKLTVVVKRVGPALTGFFATSALRSFGAPPPVSFLTAALAIRSGIQSGKYLADTEIKKVALQTGMNRLQGETDHDLVRMWDRAKSGAPFEGKQGDALAHAIRQEASLARYLVDRRQETFEGREVGSAEKLAAKQLTRYALELEASLEGTSPPAKALAEARHNLTSSAKEAELRALPSLIQLAPPASQGADTEKAFTGLMHQYGLQMLAASNPALLRLVTQLEAQDRKPSEGELTYLKQRVGPEPSIGEVLALHRLHAEGKVDLASLWDPSARVGLPVGGELAPPSLQEMLDGLGHRDAGARREWWGQALVRAVPFVGAGIGAGILALFGDPTLAAYAVAIGGTLFGEKIGRVVGDRLARAGQVERTTSGVELASAFGPDYAASLSQFMRSDITAGDRDMVVERLRQEAGALRAMIAVSRADHASLAAHAAANPEATESEALGRELYAREHLREPALAALEDFATKLEAIAGSERELPALRQAFTEARANLWPLMGNLALDVLTTGPEAEVRMQHGIYYLVKTKLAQDLLSGTNEETAKKGATEVALARAALPRGERPKADALDDWAEDVKKKPEKVSQLRLVSKLLSPAYVAKLEKAGQEAQELPADRAKEIAQETLNALMTQVYSRFGLFEASRVPELSNLTVERLPTSAPGELANHKVTGRLPGKGRFELELDPLGRPVPSFERLTLDLGPTLLQELAKAALSRQLAALEGAPPSLGKGRLVSRSEDGETYTFGFESSGRRLEVLIGADGSLPPDFAKL